MKYPLPVRAAVVVTAVLVSACGGSSGGDTPSGETPIVPPDPDTQDDNVGPVISNFAVDMATSTTGRPVEFSWSVSDADGDLLQCTLDTNDDGEPEYSFADCESVLMQSHVYDAPGSYSATLNVTDPSNGSSSRSVNIEVTGVQSSAPAISNFSATPASVVIGASTEFTWNITDPSESGVGCTIDVDNDGTPEYDLADCVAQSSMQHTYAAIGDFTALLVASNADDESRERTTTVSVTAGEGVDPTNTAPVITSYLVDSSSVMIEEPVTFTFSQSDANNDTVQCSIDFDGDGNADTPSTNCASETTVSHIYDFPGSYDAVLTVNDGRGGVVTEERTITVVPLTFKLAADGPAVPGSVLRYTYTFSNVSLTPVDNIRVLFRTPTGLSYRGRDDASPDASCFTCSEDTEAAWTFTSMQAGESRTIEILAQVSESLAPDSIIRASVNVTADAISGSVNRRIETPVKSRVSAVLKLSATDDALIAGDSLTVTADIGNISNDSLNDVNLEMALPEGSTVGIISDGGIAGDDGIVTWSIGSLPVLETVARRVTFTLSSEAIPGQIKMTSATLTGTGNDSVDSSAMLPVSISEDRSQLQVDVSTTADPVNAGGNVRYQITIGNRALVPATNVNVVMRTPIGLSYRGRDDATPNASCFTCSQGVEAAWALGSIPAGESRVIELNADVSPDLQAGTIIQASVLASADTLGDTINVFDVLAVDNRESSVVILSTPVDGYLAGDTVNLTADIGNVSTGFLEGVSLGVTLPPGATFISATDDGIHDASLNEVNWDVNSVPVLSTAQRSVNFTLASDMLAGEVAPLSARVKHDGGPVVDASTAYRLNIVERASPLEVTVATDEGSATPGQRLRYTVTLKNNAFVPLNDVSVIYRVPAGLTFSGRDDVEPNASCFTCNNGVEASWVYDSIPAGETRIIDINAQVSTDLQAGNILISPFVIRANNLPNDVSVNTVTSVTQ